MTQYGRKWSDQHRAAGYPEQDFGPPPTAKSKMVGRYDGVDQEGNSIVIEVEFLSQGVSGPELALTFGAPNGWRVTVVSEEVAQQYLTMHAAVKIL